MWADSWMLHLSWHFANFHETHYLQGKSHSSAPHVIQTVRMFLSVQYSISISARTDVLSIPALLTGLYGNKSNIHKIINLSFLVSCVWVTLQLLDSVTDSKHYCLVTNSINHVPPGAMVLHILDYFHLKHAMHGMLLLSVIQKIHTKSETYVGELLYKYKC